LLTTILAAINHGGVGHHVLWLEYNDPTTLEVWAKQLYGMAITYLIAVNIPKFAILVLYYRLFPTKNTRIPIYTLMTVLGLYTLIMVPIGIFGCSPIAANWDFTITNPKCIDKEAFFIWSGLPNIVTDLCMLVLPLPVVWNLHASRHLKAGLTFTFLVGSA
jgi:hypothetical protein